VHYQSDQFLDKNKDYVVAEHQDLLTASKCPFVAGLFPLLPEETSKSSKFSSIGSRFKVSFFSWASLLHVWIYSTKKKHHALTCTHARAYKLNCNIIIRKLTNHAFIS